MNETTLRWSGRRPIIWLTGFMGTGKSTVGQALATRLQRTCYDTDSLVAEAVGMSVASLFATAGEDEFRAQERAAVIQAARQPDCVVALGGGAILDAENRAVIWGSGPVICLTAKPETILQRLTPAEAAARPLLAGPDPSAAITTLLASREAAYARADLSVATDEISPAEVAATIANWLEARQWL